MVADEIYLEVLQILPDADVEYKLRGQYVVQVDSVDEAKSLYYDLKAKGVFDRLKPYIARVHIHRHSPEGNKPCETIEIERVE